MRLIPDQLEILELEAEDVGDVGVEVHFGELEGLARQLFLSLREMVFVDVRVAEGVDELAGLQAADLRHHQRQQRV